MSTSESRAPVEPTRETPDDIVIESKGQRIVYRRGALGTWRMTQGATLVGSFSAALDEVTALRAQLAEASRSNLPIDTVDADRLAGAVCKMIDRGDLSARSVVGDALLDYACTRHGDARPIERVRETYAEIESRLAAWRVPLSETERDA